MPTKITFLNSSDGEESPEGSYQGKPSLECNFGASFLLNSMLVNNMKLRLGAMSDMEPSFDAMMDMEQSIDANQ